MNPSEYAHDIRAFIYVQSLSYSHSAGRGGGGNMTSTSTVDDFGLGSMSLEEREAYEKVHKDDVAGSGGRGEWL